VSDQASRLTVHRRHVTADSDHEWRLKVHPRCVIGVSDTGDTKEAALPTKEAPLGGQGGSEC
jgi:hypothetical protein